MTDPHVIVTERMVLRSAEAADADRLADVWRAPEVRRFLWDDRMLERDEVAEVIEASDASFAEHGYGLWLAEPREDTSAASLRGFTGLCGFAGLWRFAERDGPELLFGLSPRHLGRGLATELARAMIAHAVGPLRFARVVGSTDAANVASMRVMERAGMERFDRRLVGGLDTLFFAIEPAGDEAADG